MSLYNRYRKYQKYLYGEPFTPTTYKNELLGQWEYETNQDCVDNIMYQWIPVEGGYVCQFVSKYQQEKKQVSRDYGKTWTDVEPLETRIGALLEDVSDDCKKEFKDTDIGDYMIYDNINGEYFFIDMDNGVNNEDTRFSVVGRVAVPPKHDLYGDGSGAIFRGIRQNAAPTTNKKYVRNYRYLTGIEEKVMYFGRYGNDLVPELADEGEIGNYIYNDDYKRVRYGNIDECILVPSKKDRNLSEMYAYLRKFRYDTDVFSDIYGIEQAYLGDNLYIPAAGELVYLIVNKSIFNIGNDYQSDLTSSTTTGIYTLLPDGSIEVANYYPMSFQNIYPYMTSWIAEDEYHYTPIFSRWNGERFLNQLKYESDGNTITLYNLEYEKLEEKEYINDGWVNTGRYAIGYETKYNSIWESYANFFMRIGNNLHMMLFFKYRRELNSIPSNDVRIIPGPMFNENDDAKMEITLKDNDTGEYIRSGELNSVNDWNYSGIGIAGNKKDDGTYLTFAMNVMVSNNITMFDDVQNFSTYNTSKGQWSLPTIDELRSFLNQLRSEISVQNIIQMYGRVNENIKIYSSTQGDTSRYLWSAFLNWGNNSIGYAQSDVKNKTLYFIPKIGDSEYIAYRWEVLNDETMCDGTDEYYVETYQQSTNGTDWVNVEPLQTRKGELKQAMSFDCVQFNDVVMYNENENKLEIVPDLNHNLDGYPKEVYTPIGIVLSKDIGYGDGSYTVMGYRMLDTYNPDNGLGNTNGIAILGSIYGSDASLDDYPYYSTGDEALEDLTTGKDKTKRMVDDSTYYPSWKTSSTINNSQVRHHWPAACCSWRFHTVGTEQGDWYLPTAGEVNIVLANKSQINLMLDFLNQNYGVSAFTLPDKAYGSVTMYNGANYWYNSTGWYHTINSTSNRWIPFIRIMPDGTVVR